LLHHGIECNRIYCNNRVSIYRIDTRVYPWVVCIFCTFLHLCKVQRGDKTAIILHFLHLSLKGDAKVQIDVQ
jgi:hypothetical protein